ncbi:aldo/keto reductase [Bacillus benzoevorans]|uniref:Aryl-alcohol dehydrogenase-like predicted oxidoreductase n=1 Tax=Bacillus benzoevorans TaxID=1456 RepID=A0A7X0HUI6_9BACI|nr:aldo/keto reductase [Bacillus benzoevorans]MBB6447127.1 aryl-alcohol dehydrogenase-like predicted oxidoreductase [Bacillus benzoevorans]
MKYRYLGNSGLRVSALGLGTNAFGKRADKAASTRVIHQALDQGINFIDTANIYTNTMSESIIGEALESKRHEVILATKAGLPCGKGPNDKGSSRYHIQREIEGSLKRLRTDYIDLYQIHSFDPNTPLEETLRTLDDLVRAGKVRYIGASNYAAWELMKALGISERDGLSQFISVQQSYSLADRTIERELIPCCLDQGAGVIPYFPLAAGILTGKYGDGTKVPEGSRLDTDPNSIISQRLGAKYLQLANQVSTIAKELDASPAALSLSWLLSRPVVSTIIVGATREEQVIENMECLSLNLDSSTLEALDHVSLPFKNGEPFASYRLPKEVGN